MLLRSALKALILPVMGWVDVRGCLIATDKTKSESTSQDERNIFHDNSFKFLTRESWLDDDCEPEKSLGSRNQIQHPLRSVCRIRLWSDGFVAFERAYCCKRSMLEYRHRSEFTMTEPIQLVIVDDHPLYREGVASTLNAESDMRVIGEGGNADDALALGAARVNRKNREALHDQYFAKITSQKSG